MKTCKACGEAKPLDQYHRDRSKADGLNFYCKPCAIARQKVFALRPPRNPPPEGMRKCVRCKETKPLEEFHNSTGDYGGKARSCKACSAANTKAWGEKNPERRRELRKEWGQKNKRRDKDFKLRKHYGLPLGAYEEMLAAQGGGCGICLSETPGGNGDFHVDHCHDSGKVRGLLCHSCNVGLGHFRSNPDLLWSAVQYLDASRK